MKTRKNLYAPESWRGFPGCYCCWSMGTTLTPESLTQSLQNPMAHGGAFYKQRWFIKVEISDNRNETKYSTVVLRLQLCYKWHHARNKRRDEVNHLVNYSLSYDLTGVVRVERPLIRFNLGHEDTVVQVKVVIAWTPLRHIFEDGIQNVSINVASGLYAVSENHWIMNLSSKHKEAAFYKFNPLAAVGR